MTSKIDSLLPIVNGMDNEGQVRVLGIIDKLRELGINDNVSLSQLVAVGDQSSGKSSLLEGLTGLSFPIASDLCTRFATQIVLRRTAPEDAGALITIIPGPTAQANDELKAHLLTFQHNLREDEFGIDEFRDIFDKAAQYLGVPGPSSMNLEGLDKRFSDDILKIELSGPQHRHLSVVDVPGLFHNPTQYQTLEDRDIIRGLIEKYIPISAQSFCQAVMDARNNFANQEVFTMARSADPQGTRTVGIITKCDAVQPGDEHGVVKIAQNEVERLNHGWFVVRNRSTKEIQDGVTIEGRHKKEKHFFSTENPWTKLKRDRVGIHSLKDFLGRLLYNHIRGEFPGMVKEIEELSQRTQEELGLLGPPRQSSMDQRKYLTDIGSRYQKHVTNALSGNYDPCLDANSPLKLRMHIRSLNDQFAKDMACDGHFKMFRTIYGNVEEFLRSSGDQQDIYDWIRVLYRDSRGAELPGTVNPAVLENMFRHQSVPWENIAKTYIEGACASISTYNRESLATIIGDDDVREGLMSQIRRQEEVTAARSIDQLSTILNDERGGILQTVNHYFADTLSSIRQDRVLARLENLGLKDGCQYNAKDVLRGVHLSNEDQAVDDIHDILKAYYKLAMKRFCDNVVLQVTERCLLGEDAAIRFLSPEHAGGMNDSELEGVAGENYATSSARNELQLKIKRFQRALEIARQAGV